MPISEGKIKELVIEDDDVSGPMIAERLRKEGYGAGWCRDRKTMRRLIAEKPARRPFDVLVLDLALPDAFGAEILDELAGSPQTNPVKVVIITGTLGHGEEEMFMERLKPSSRTLVSKILIKPYNYSLLIAAVKYAAESI
jgi:DNA-binding response OmpR family regulator